MQFLKILFWCLLAFVAALFTYGNWATVPIHLWSGLIAEVNLPLLLLVTFLIGFVPAWFYYNFNRWRLRSRLTTAERTIADLRLSLDPPAAPVISMAEPVIAPAPPPPPGTLL
ncbi:MAG: lipopolysaccharide assembly protein LapA domain-containing protein [Pseudomonadota bacterium]|nr:lipopolysaccharide assembly protein LapA domain-containing protein [Pseudomonadota bacterium]